MAQFLCCSMDHQVKVNHSIHYLFHHLIFQYYLGTGKTSTLVAAIAEIVKSSNDFVLVLTHSNAACDELTTRLAKVLKKNELFRLYAKSFNKKKLTPTIKGVCNLHNGEFRYPCLKYLYQYRVVVTTLMAAGNLVRSRGEDSDFDSGHFARIIIDEAGCVQEPASMIPIVGLCLFSFYHFDS